MIDKTKLQEAIAGYKLYFPTHWRLEKFKWETLKVCSQYFDIEAVDFITMWKKCISKSGAMLNSRNNFAGGQIGSFFQEKPEHLREMFRYLFNEDIDFLSRIKYFREESNKILKEHNAKHPEAVWKTCYQTTNAISTYLWMRFPDKYYIYKYSECRAADKLLSGDQPVIRGGYNDDVIKGYQLYDEIRHELAKDTELVQMFEQAKDDSCYADKNLITLTIDFGYYLSRYYMKEQPKPEVPQTQEKTDTPKAEPVFSGEQNFWWLTGSPKFWSPSEDWELGDAIDYTLYNDKGNKRRISKHFLEANPGDVVIAYEATPILQIVAIGKLCLKPTEKYSTSARWKS